MYTSQAEAFRDVFMIYTAGAAEQGGQGGLKPLHSAEQRGIAPPL